MTHALQVLHTLQWHHPGGRALLQLAQGPTQDYHSYTHALLGVVEDEVTSPNGSPVRLQESHWSKLANKIQTVQCERQCRKRVFARTARKHTFM